MRILSLVILCVLSSPAWSQDRNGSATAPGPQGPRWVTFDTPRYDRSYGAEISLPRGYRLCGVGASYSSLEAYYVPVDPRQGCALTDLSKVDFDLMPDFVVIGHLPDTAMQYKTTADYVKAEPFFCHGMSYDSKTAKPITHSPTSIEPADKVLGGLDTIVCTREDKEKHRYSKAFHAYRPGPDGVGHEYEIAAYVHLQNKRQADKLVEQIVRAFRLIEE